MFTVCCLVMKLMLGRAATVADVKGSACKKAYDLAGLCCLAVAAQNNAMLQIKTHASKLVSSACRWLIGAG